MAKSGSTLATLPWVGSGLWQTHVLGRLCGSLGRFNRGWIMGSRPVGRNSSLPRGHRPTAGPGRPGLHLPTGPDSASIQNIVFTARRPRPLEVVTLHPVLPWQPTVCFLSLWICLF